MNGTVLIAILAAGKSRRFGTDKLAAHYNGQPLGAHVLSAAQSTGHPIMWITSNTDSWTPTDCEILCNPCADQGLGTSVALAAKTAQDRKANALLILLADMPMVSAELLQSMLAKGAPLCCRYPDGNPGPPALLPAQQFAQLNHLQGDVGARHMLNAVPRMAFIEPTAALLTDIDTPDDLLHLI